MRVAWREPSMAFALPERTRPRGRASVISMLLSVPTMIAATYPFLWAHG
jgi:hypothetical protein